ncbi:hypothetical protein [Sphingomonas sp. SUN039]|uniref:hypothetical protein n=1 Tax=Sphingomonas sp. SUN039 TaxID=2937787 RepID=UPI002164E974|nr:hypothetical protein [Sphingomonas sp. SUN039]UVO54626.1 hypothetical protein M0209_11025 [Sphingomonas sp. SUN039]
MTPIAYGLLVAATSVAPAPAPAAEAAAPPPTTQVQVTQMLIQQRIIIRVPAMSPPPPPPRPIKWKEVKGPKCVPVSQLAGASIGQNDTVDLFLRGGTRLRAKLDDDCPALDYYSGFYLAPTPDGQVCQRRDMLHTRAGQQCRVERFRMLVPER